MTTKKWSTFLETDFDLELSAKASGFGASVSGEFKDSKEKQMADTFNSYTLD